MNAATATSDSTSKHATAIADEELHAIGTDPHWQESIYFNWADPEGHSFGLTRIAYRFNEKRMDGVLLTLRDGKPHYAYAPVNLDIEPNAASLQARDGYRTHGLHYRMEEPLKRWRISLDDEKGSNGELTWTAFTPGYNFHGDPSASADVLASNHFEQSGRVEGVLTLHGERIEVNGFGQRDKSWGPRDWAKLRGWNWIAAQFGDDLAFNATNGYEGDTFGINGYVFRDGENHALRELSIRHECKQAHVPLSTLISMRDDKGVRYEVRATALGQFPLFKKGFMIQETHSLFEMTVDGRLRRGIGIVEHGWHANLAQTLYRMPRLIGAYREAKNGPRK